MDIVCKKKIMFDYRLSPFDGITLWIFQLICSTQRFCWWMPFMQTSIGTSMQDKCMCLTCSKFRGLILLWSGNWHGRRLSKQSQVDQINQKQLWRFERDSPFDFLNQFELLELNFNILLNCMPNSYPVEKSDLLPIWINIVISV